MTTGQRIAARRKELNLSQESLGETLGVSRQSIYKWESDGTLPEIDKLVAMSRLFGVSVGWLLGVEEQPPSTTDGSAADTLTEGQLRMVEEILSRYRSLEQDTLNEKQREQVETLLEEKLARKPKKRRWFYSVLCVLCIIAAGAYLMQQLDRIDQRYDDLAYSVNNMTDDVNRDIGSIANRVEEVLKTQNHLTAEYDTELLGGDLMANTVSFSARAVPRTYTEEMSVIFLADHGDGVLEFAGQPGQGREYSAEITCPLTDSITLSAVFTANGVSQTQVLDVYSYLYSGTLPIVEINEHKLFWKDAEAGDPYTFVWKDEYVDVRLDSYNHYRNGLNDLEQAEEAGVKVGLFLNRELVKWLPPIEPPASFHGDTEDLQFFALTDLTLKLEDGDLLQLCALVTDEYGRTFLRPQETPPFTPVDGELDYAAHVYTYEGIQNPADWGVG